MLDDRVKQEIQSAYRQLLESRNLIPRYGQRQMIAEIAKSLASIDPNAEDSVPPICVIEAGTGTGKTLAYVLAALPIAKSLDLKVVISTATVALQEQVVFKDLPDILRGCDLEFTLSLAKGRGRYLCLSKLDGLLQGNDSLDELYDLYGTEVEAGDQGLQEQDRLLYEELLRSLSDGSWDGDRDNWDKPVREREWSRVTVNEGQCLGTKCSNFRSCCFYKARESLESADCIVTNHDLVLSDLALGGGAILPPTSKTLFIFDEAHHLPLKSNNHFSRSSRMQSTINWLESTKSLLPRLAKDQFLEIAEAEELQGTLGLINMSLAEACTLLYQIKDDPGMAEQAGSNRSSRPGFDSFSEFAFKLGLVPEALKEISAKLMVHFGQLQGKLEDLIDTLKEALDEESNLKRKQSAEQWYPLIGGNAKRAGANFELWRSFASTDNSEGAPQARWMRFNEEEAEPEITLSSSPVLAAENLTESLWGKCAGAVLTSATLSALGHFDMLRMRSGLPDHTLYYSIPSPFDYARAASIVVPKLDCEPGNAEGHTAAIIASLPQLIEEGDAALMLFSSRRQMLDVLQGLPTAYRDLVLCQDDFQKSQLLKYHRQRVDEGKGSVIFGLSSFAEGVDLPGKYCTHVLIAKIPFAVPNDPIELTLSDWVEANGQNAFMTLSVPDAAFKLVQATGRLLRSENDTGRITLFDERIVSKRYGKAILDSLPPYQQRLLVSDF